jgi:EAL domain-containing protein (putative c-di-GMP-specific phosphodiesterase class I)
VAIDDFGTGYSALGYLRQVPLDIVKLDRIFISTMATSTRQRELVRGIVQLTRTLGLTVVAEGIETERQRDISASIGCGFGQGFLFSASMSQRDAVAWTMRGAAEP